MTIHFGTNGGGGVAVVVMMIVYVKGKMASVESSNTAPKIFGVQKRIFPPVCGVLA